MPVLFHNRTRAFYALCAAVFFTIAAADLSAQNFRPGTRLWVINTEHFEIIYSAESAPTAQRLAAVADSIYDRISGLLGISVKRKVPVTITAHTDEFNGYMNPVPYSHIVLFDTPASLEWTSFENALESLFLHELTHAVSGNTRSPFLEGLRSIFGGWVYPAGLNAPWFMIEGVSVSFESLTTLSGASGLGRANDPLVKQKLRQDIHEGKFKTPFQAAGVWDLPPGGNVYYYYGGLFSAYLQKTYGMEKYAELWQQMGQRFPVSLILYNSGFYGIFKMVYKKPILDVWEEFEESLRLEGLLENTEGRLSSGSTLIADLAEGGGKVFFLDSHAGKIFAYEPADGNVANTKSRQKAVVSLDNAAYAIDVSKDGKQVLVSTYQRKGANAGQLSRAVVLEYNLATGRRTGRKWEGIYQGRYFRDGIAGIQSDTHRTNLVYISADNTAEILLFGGEELVYSNPTAIDENWLAFTSAKRGIRQISLYHYASKEVYLLKSDLKDDVERWRYLRGLRVSGGRLMFAYNHNDRMYKPGAVELGTINAGSRLQASFAEKDFSGSVFNPVCLDNGEIYYRGAFSVWDSLMRYNVPVSEAADTTASVRLEAWERNWLDIARRQETAIAALAGGNETGTVFKAQSYFPLKYYNPFKLWLPYPHISSGINAQAMPVINFTGAGIFSYLSDPLDNNLILFNAAFDWKYLMAPFSVTWTNFSLSVPLEVKLTDSVDETLSLTHFPYRTVSATASARIRFPLGSEWLSLYLLPSFGASFFSWPKYGDYYNTQGNFGEESAYTWPLQQSAYSGTMGVSLSSRRRFRWETFGNGITESVYARLAMRDKVVGIPRYENVLQGAIETSSLPSFAAQLTVYGVYDKSGMTLQGTSNSYTSTMFSSVAASEYTFGREFYPLSWLTGGEAQVKLFSVGIDKNLGGIYLNRIYATLGYRWAYFGNQAAVLAPQFNTSVHSIVFRFNTVVSATPLTVAVVKLTASFWAVYRLSYFWMQPEKIIDDPSGPLSLGISLLSVEY